MPGSNSGVKQVPACPAQRRVGVLERGSHRFSADELIEREIKELLDRLESASLPVSDGDLRIFDVLRYHLGFVDETFQPSTAYAGKRIRPKLCLMCCQAGGGDPEISLPVAAAVELLHNFTLIHDDIQDRSNLRRHRPTIRALWGDAQAINAGDTMFAVSHLALNRLAKRGVDPAIIVELSSSLHETTLRIVEGQVLDIGFEDRADVEVAEYLTMIRGKTAAILGFSCAAGAILAGANQKQVELFANFGEALGLGFQVLDDELGVWGDSNRTGKPEADDIRKRKKALPFLLLHRSASTADRQSLNTIMSEEVPTDRQVAQVLELMMRYEIRDDVRRQIHLWHDRALEYLDGLCIRQPEAAELRALVAGLSSRSF